MISSPKSETDIVIVGAGLIGLTTGYEFLRRGYRVAIIEAGDEVAAGASFANGGMLTPSMSDPWNSPGVFRQLMWSLLDPYSAMKLRVRAAPGLLGWGLKFLHNSSESRYLSATKASYRLARYSSEATRGLCNELSLAFDESELGTIKIFRDSHAMVKPLRLSQMLALEGLEFEVLDRDATIEVEPQLASIREQIAGALRFPKDWSGDARLFSIGLAEKIRKLGGTIKLGVMVNGVDLSGGRVAAVQTSAGSHSTRTVVLANGSLSARFARQLGMSVAVAPAKGYSITFDVSDLPQRPRIPVVDDAMHAAITPLGNRLRVVGTAEFAGFDRSVQTTRVDNLKRLLDAVYPQIAQKVNMKGAQSWAGLRPMSADGLPYIGSTNIPGFWLNTGHGHLGWTMAVGSSRLLADLFESKTPAIDASPYRFDR